MPVAPATMRILGALGLGMAMLFCTFILLRGELTLSSRVVTDGTEGDADALYNTAVSLLAREEYEPAVDKLNRAITIYTKLASSARREFLSDMRETIATKGRYDNPAKRDRLPHEWLRNQGKQANAMAKRGEAYSKIGQFDAAIADLSGAIRLGLDRETETYILRAAAYRAVGETMKAEWDERQAEFRSRTKETAQR